MKAFQSYCLRSDSQKHSMTLPAKPVLSNLSRNRFICWGRVRSKSIAANEYPEKTGNEIKIKDRVLKYRSMGRSLGEERPVSTFPEPPMLNNPWLWKSGNWNRKILRIFSSSFHDILAIERILRSFLNGFLIVFGASLFKLISPTACPGKNYSPTLQARAHCALKFKFFLRFFAGEDFSKLLPDYAG